MKVIARSTLKGDFNGRMLYYYPFSTCLPANVCKLGQQLVMQIKEDIFIYRLDQYSEKSNNTATVCNAMIKGLLYYINSDQLLFNNMTVFHKSASLLSLIFNRVTNSAPALEINTALCAFTCILIILISSYLIST